MGWESFGEVKRNFRGKDPLHDVGYQDFPLFAVGHALARTLDRFKDAGDGFNRNLTQHRIGSPHNEPNLLMVILLLGGLVREVERVLNRHERARGGEGGLAAPHVRPFNACVKLNADRDHDCTTDRSAPFSISSAITRSSLRGIGRRHRLVTVDLTGWRCGVVMRRLDLAREFSSSLPAGSLLSAA